MGRIHKLPEQVIRQIAAGEVLIRPVNAVKELLENSLDAQASHITIIVNDGGLRGLSISDDGTGIDQDDLALLCERYATSKLSDASHLSKIGTFGFRGEALASIAMVSRMTVLTMTEGQDCGWRAVYGQGRIQGDLVKMARSSTGTTIIIDDLFYAYPERRKTFLAKANDEYHRIAEVIMCYALGSAGKVGFTLKKGPINGNSGIPTFQVLSTMTRLQIIAAGWGNDLASNCVEMSHSDHACSDSPHSQASSFNVSVDMVHSNAYYRRKEGVFIILVNGRLAEWPLLTKAVRNLYGQVILSGWQPWFFAAFQVPSERVDVNVSPTKHTVALADAEEIVDWVIGKLKDSLKFSGKSKQMSSPLISPTSVKPSEPIAKSIENIRNFSSPKQTAPYKRVYSDYRTTKIDQYIPSSPRSPEVTLSSPVKKVQILPQARDDDRPSSISVQNEIGVQIDERLDEAAKELEDPAPCELSSVCRLKEEILSGKSDEVSLVIKRHVMVGCALEGRKAFIQYETCLLMVDTDSFSKEYFYFKFLYSLGQLQVLEFPERLDCECLVEESLGKVALDKSIDQARLVKDICILLHDKRQFFAKYFSLCIDEDNRLVSVPWVIEEPALPKRSLLGLLLLRLAIEVEWNGDEEGVLKKICQEFSLIYSVLPFDTCEDNIAYLQNRLYPAFKFGTRGVMVDNVVPFSSRLAIAGNISLITDVHSLYKIFDRC